MPPIPVWKEVLCVGRQQSKDGEWFEFKPQNIRRAHKNFQRMRARGVPLPAVWEHQKIEAADAPAGADAVAEWKRRYARYTFAHAADSRINERGNLDMLLPVHTPEEAEQLKRVKFVSPKVYRHGYWDSQGGTYDGTTVAHVAATPTPVQFWQKPFADLSADDAVFLSFALPDGEHLEGADPDESCPPFNWSFSDWLNELDRSVELSTTDAPEESPVPEEKKTEEKPKGDGEGKGKCPEDLKELIDALKAKGMTISDKVCNLKELVIAVESSAGPEEETPPPDETPEPEDDTDDGETTAAPGGPPMLMSTTDTDPVKRKKAIKEAAVERTELGKRIKGAFATGRIDGPTQRKLLRQAEAVEMSFTDGEPTGKKWKKLVGDVAAAEKKAANSAWNAKAPAKPVDLSTTNPIEPPEQKDQPNDKRASATSDWLLGRGDHPDKVCPK